MCWSVDYFSLEDFSWCPGSLHVEYFWIVSLTFLTSCYKTSPVTVHWRILICCGGVWFTRQFSYYAETWSSVLSSMDRVPMSAELKPLPCCFWSVLDLDSSGPSRELGSVHTYNWEALIFRFLHAAVFRIVSDSQGSLFLFLWLGNWFLLLFKRFSYLHWWSFAQWGLPLEQIGVPCPVPLASKIGFLYKIHCLYQVESATLKLPLIK